MKLYSSLLVYTAVANMILAPTVSYAQSASSYAQQNKGYASVTTSPTDYRIEIKDGNKAAMVDAKTGDTAMEIPFTPEGQLRRFEPTQLNKAIAEELTRVKASGKAAFSHSVKALPTESAIFFMAMGAVVAGQLMLNYSANPLAMEQHIEHHMSPLGTFGFFTFMMSQGVTSNMLSMYIKNPKMHFMIPYMGMAVGAFTQSYLTQMLGDINVMTCAKTMMGQKVSEKDLQAGADQDPCGKAYEYLVINKKIWEFAPGMVSVVLSAGLAAGAQWVLTKGILITRGIDIGLYLMPGKLQLTGIRLLLVKGLQIGAFGAIDVAINRFITTHWKNVFDGADFNDMNKKIVYEINRQKMNGWDTKDKNAEKELKHFNKKMAEWRMMNMSEVYESHQSWSDNIQRLMQMYNSSEAFYSTFVDELRNSKFGKSYVKPLEISYPFFGVKSKDLAAGKEDLYFTSPKAMEPLQRSTLTDTVEFINKIYVEKDLKKSLMPHEEKIIAEIRDLLSQDSDDKKVAGLEALNRAMNMALRQINSSRLYYETLYRIRENIGGPVPLMEPGRGFLYTYEKAPMNEQVVKGIPFYKTVGRYATPQLTDYFLMQMICGPEVTKNQSSVQETKGFKTLFVPPSLRNTSHDFGAECEGYNNYTSQSNLNIYSTPIRQGGNFKGYLSYLKENIRPEILGDKENKTFSDWWKKNTESQMIKAFESYEDSYTDVINKLIYHVTTNEMRSTNMGPIANGAMASILQEERIYLSILEDMLSPSTSFTMSFKDKATQGPKSEIGLKIEESFQQMFMMFNQIKVGKQGGKKILLSDIENYQFEEQLKNIQTSLSDLSKMLGANKGEDSAQTAVVKLNEAQIQLAVTALEGLQSIATELMMYGTIANAVTWSKIRDLKRIDMERQQFNNDIQKKLSQMRGLMPIGGR